MSNDGPIYHKFNVTRTDGKHRLGEKHDGCDYFVLDITHDPYAAKAMLAYSDVCQLTHPELSTDIRRRVAAISSTTQDDGGNKPEESNA